MSVQVEKLEKNMAKLTIEVSSEEFEKAIAKAYKKNKNKISMPGFRKGKAPRTMIEKMYGKGVFYEDAANSIIPDAYADAAKESELEIVAQPEIDVTQIESGKPFIFTATVALKPEVTLGEYKGIEVEKKEVEVTDEEVYGAYVTETEEDAKKLIEHLRTNNLGRASFLPITSVKGKKLDNIKGKKDGVIGIACDLIKFDKKYEQIVLNLLGRTVIVDDMQNAIKLSKENNYSFRIITLEGDVINPSGAITGGSVTKKTINILGRSKEIEELNAQITEIKEKISKLEKSKEEYENSSENVLEEAENLEKQLQEIEISYATEKQRVESIDENIQTIRDRINKQKEEISKSEENKKELLKSKELIKLMKKVNTKFSKWIRLRKTGDNTTITIKRIVNGNGEYKIDAVSELEIPIPSLEYGKEFLEDLGYFYKRRQSKMRIAYDYKNTEIVIDKWPKISPYLEIEGPTLDEIMEVVYLLGYKDSDVKIVNTDTVYLEQGIDIYKEEYNNLDFSKEEINIIKKYME